MEKVVSGEHGDKQNNVTEDRNENGTSNDLVDNADIEGPVFADVQEETGAEELSSTKMVTEVTLFPSMCVKRKNKITEKRKLWKVIWKQSIQNDEAWQEKISAGKRWQHCEISSAYVDCRRCDSRNILRVIMEVDLTKDL